MKCTITTLKTFCHSQKLAYFSIKWFGQTESSSMISELWLVGLIFDPGRPLSESENILFLVNNYCLCQQFLFQCQYPIKYWLRRFVECSTSVKYVVRVGKHLVFVNNYCLCQQFLFQCQYLIKYWLRRFVECSTSVKWAFRCHNSDSYLTKSDLLVVK